MIDHLKKSLAIAALILIGACAGLNVEEVPLTQPEIPPFDAQPAPVAFNKIRYAIPTGTPVVSQSPKGLFGLINCGFPYGLTEQTGISARLFPNDEYRRIFSDTLEGQGYDVAGDPGLLFDEQEDMARANYAIGARVVDIKMDLCRKTSLSGVYRGDVGEANIDIEWTVFDLLNRKNMLKTTTRGYAKQKIINYETIELLVQKAFIAATHNLGAHEDFYNLVFFGTPPTKLPDTVHDPYEDPIVIYDPDEKIVLENPPLHIGPAQGRLEQIRKTAVMVEAGAGRGSGFFITGDGHILTNYHVVGNAQRARIVTSNKEEKMIAEVLRVNRRRDVALLKLEEKPENLEIHTLPIRMDRPKVGEDVYAIGAPAIRRLQDTVTKGIISALRYDRRKKQFYLQADVYIYGGNSGGPLIDDHGNIVGIAVSGWQTGGQDLSGLNNFIPIDDAFDELDITVNEE